MSRRWIIGLAAAALFAPSTSAAQEARARAVVSGSVDQGAAGRGGRVVAYGLETKITTGRPYSAEAVTETTQVLGDGNRIHNRSVTRVYRDGEGRTRREMFDREGALVSISISDPVAKTSFTLDPKTKTAHQISRYVLATPTTTGTYVYSERATGVAVTSSPLERQPTRVVSGSGGGVVSPARTAAPDDPNGKKEDLGIQNLEGVSATGSRTTRVIPAGEIGNAQEIRVVSEQWFSDELQVLVMTRHADPRNGETVYRLTNILRAEPDPNLFSVPPGYTVQERRIRQQ
ncbi:MAG TPA: hypothetical protein VGD94_23245 [Vicinamibacterales bacterium]